MGRETPMTLREYVDSIRNKRVAVIGIGVSNTPLVRLLLDHGIRVTADTPSGVCWSFVCRTVGEEALPLLTTVIG